MKKLLRKFKNRLTGRRPTKWPRASLPPEGTHRGNVLLSYIVEPLLLEKETQISNAHHHDWLSWKIARTFSRLGYAVDAVDYRDRVFRPEKPYNFFIGARTNFQRISKLLDKACLKIVHLDMAHWLFNNFAAYERCLDIQKRRGAALKSYKMQEMNWAIESADLATTNLGNQFNVGTYAYSGKPIYQFPLPSCSTFPFPESKDFEACRKHFIWFGSRGLAHKGLDLVLEAFAGMPDYHLTVCGPVRVENNTSKNFHFSPETDFEKAHHRELFNTPNIRTVGWVDIDTQVFREITNNAMAVIFPSCAEGGGASVITCMHAGLIPCVSYESNVEVGSFGITLKENTISEIQYSVKEMSSWPAEKIHRRARKAWKFARKFHTREYFSNEYERFVSRLVHDKLGNDKYNADYFAAVE